MSDQQIQLMPDGPDEHPDASLRREDWESIRILNSYRLFIAIALLVAFLADVRTVEFGVTAPLLFYTASAVYLFAAIAFAWTIHRRVPDARIQAYLHLYTDLILLTVATYGSGGVASGLGTLLVVPIAGAGTLLAARHALLAAALGSLLLLGIESIRAFRIDAGAAAYPQAAVLGITLFAAALLAAALARRSAESAEIARRRSVDVQRLSALNERIVQHMEAGILVVDPSGRISLANASAGVLLDDPATLTGRRVDDVAPGLVAALDRWSRDGRTSPEPLTAKPGANRRLQVQFTALGEPGTLLSIEDARFIEEQVQQLKLASLGRLTASIAHEIRNPLGAISHSAQLLEESEAIPEADRRLTGIMLAHSRRVNHIVESVLELSRQRGGEGTTVELAEWLPDFARQYAHDHQLGTDRLRHTAPGTALRVHFDPGQLDQIVRNLCDNSLRHGRRSDGESVIVTLCAGTDREGHTWLDVRDDGNPIDRRQVDEIFEPFFTTSHSGTGLGLFLARELCEANNARLHFVASDTGNCFRVTLQAIDDRPRHHG
ncbi:sensor histidine kinase [Halofilum ochraceum]|uniref:sensor histidine kinase n=1 Tax=Halofilum ochraceum TaxID=1611323 RepID=UPI0009F3D37C|nr:ATP-binding protein [Halofilum ochraceum]